VPYGAHLEVALHVVGDEGDDLPLGGLLQPAGPQTQHFGVDHAAARFVQCKRRAHIDVTAIMRDRSGGYMFEPFLQPIRTDTFTVEGVYLRTEDECTAFSSCGAGFVAFAGCKFPQKTPRRRTQRGLKPRADV
jgi:hypothetical protein